MKNLYQIIGVQQTAPAEVIEAAVKVLSRKFHPDNRATGNAAKFREIREASDVLCDSAKRSIYDRELSEFRKQTERETPPKRQRPSRQTQPQHPDVAQAIQDVFGRAAIEIGAEFLNQTMKQSPVLEELYRQAIMRNNRRSG